MHFKKQNYLLPLEFEEGRIQIILKSISILGNDVSMTMIVFYV